MTTVLGNALSQAFEKSKKKDVTTYVWKGARKLANGKRTQESVRMVDMSEDAIKQAIKHCKSMLYNDSIDDPGRYVLIEQIEDQIMRCNAELFIRWLAFPPEGSDRQGIQRLPWYNMMNSRIKETATNIVEQSKDSTSINDIMEQLYREWTVNDLIDLKESTSKVFANIPLYLVRDACLQALGKCVRKHITLTFITDLGLWFTRTELERLNKKDENGKLVDRIQQVADIVGIDLRTPENQKGLVLKIDDRKGLSLEQFQAMWNFRKEKYDARYNNLSTIQLEVLRDKILFFLEQKARWQASDWERRISQLEEAAKFKGYKNYE